jgi:hypothetical protein
MKIDYKDKKSSKKVKLLKKKKRYDITDLEGS